MQIEQLLMARALVMDATTGEFSVFGVLEDLTVDASGKAAVCLFVRLLVGEAPLPAPAVTMEVSILGPSGSAVHIQRFELPLVGPGNKPVRRSRLKLDIQLSFKEPGSHTIRAALFQKAAAGVEAGAETCFARRDLECGVFFLEAASSDSPWPSALSHSPLN